MSLAIVLRQGKPRRPYTLSDEVFFDLERKRVVSVEEQYVAVMQRNVLALVGVSCNSGERIQDALSIKVRVIMRKLDWPADTSTAPGFTTQEQYTRVTCLTTGM